MSYLSSGINLLLPSLLGRLVLRNLHSLQLALVEAGQVIGAGLGVVVDNLDRMGVLALLGRCMKEVLLGARARKHSGGV